MFHDEACSGICHSAQATAIREMESQVLKACPQALVLRTHAFGWSPNPAGDWLENLIDDIEANRALSIPSQNYATPIAAGCLGELVIGAWERKLEGVYHVAGSERVNFRHFAHRLAQEFQLPRPKFRTQNDAGSSSHQFGRGETSLDSSRFRRAAGTSLPMLAESLNQLREQADSGQREQLISEDTLTTAHAA
jgi:dTDP-4-dehydrorhamnose reductase